VAEEGLHADAQGFPGPLPRRQPSGWTHLGVPGTRDAWTIDID
jgi:hypothetical protein